jgi:hypothetical protein
LEGPDLVGRSALLTLMHMSIEDPCQLLKDVPEVRRNISQLETGVLVQTLQNWPNEPTPGSESRAGSPGRTWIL